MKIAHTFTLALPLALSLGLAACGDDAQFSSASDTQLAQAFESASGGDASGALFIGMALQGQNDATACPKTVTTGNETTASGDCDSTSNGIHEHWSGTVIVDNMPGFLTPSPTYDPSKPSKIEFKALHITGTDSNGKPVDTFMDGTVTANLPQNAPQTVDSDLEVKANGVDVTSSLHLSCQNHTCSPVADPASSIDIADLGTATIAGTWSLSDPPSGKLTLHGADDAVFDLGASDPNTHCVPYTIGSKTGSVCPPAN